MSSRKINVSSSSEDDEMKYAMITDEKKRKRMISNRESARRSRMKKEQHIKDLNDQITYFTTKKVEMVKKMEEIGQRFVAFDSENRALRMHGEELKKRLEMLEKMMHGNVSEVEEEDDRFVMDILQDPSLKPWLQPSFHSNNVDGIYQF
ncbi:hypothetical protein ACS0TY_027708 [Phlomoides rotata]